MSMTKLTVYRAEVMEQLIQSSDLFVMQVEMDVYTALKKVHWKMAYFIAPRYTPCTLRPVSKNSLCNFLSLQWMFLQLNQSWDGPIKQLLADADAWLCKRRTGTVRPHLGKTLIFICSLFFFVWSVKNWLCFSDLCEKEPFLSTEEGTPFRSVFKYVRLQFIINDLASARILERDNILPPGKMWHN